MRSEDETESSRRLLPKQKRRMHWKLIAVALVAVVVIAAVMVIKPWEGNPDEEYVWVQYTASFKLLSTSDNRPIENIFFEWPYPYPTPDVWENANPEKGESVWGELLELPRENIRMNLLLGKYVENRENILFHRGPGFEDWIGLKNTFPNEVPPFAENSKFTIPILYLKTSGKLYLDDEIQIEAWFFVPLETLQKLSLINNLSENHAVVGIGRFQDTTIGLKITVELKDANGFVLQKWTREIESGAPSFAIVRLENNFKF